MLHHPCILGGPQQREQNRKSKPTPGVTMMHHATKRGFKDCPKCAPLAHPLKGHWWGTGPKRCPARARRANVPPVAGHRLGALEAGEGGTSPPFQCILAIYLNLARSKPRPSPLRDTTPNQLPHQPYHCGPTGLFGLGTRDQSLWVRRR